MEKKEAWELIRQAIRGFMATYEGAMDHAAISMGLEPAGGFLVIIPAYLFEPDPISAERLRKKIPYNAPVYYEEPLLAVKNAGFLDEAPEGGYILNQKGHEAFRKIMDAAYQQLEGLTPLQPAELEELKNLLATLVQASILSPEHISKWSILHSRRLDPGREVAPTIKIDQYLSDLSAYRDDAHLASWASYSINAHAWDILGTFWKGGSYSVANIIDLTQKRRWNKSETNNAISDLMRNGWIMEDKILHITEEGRKVRNKAEELTDELFFSPWQSLEGNQYNRLCDLLMRLNENLS